MLQGRRSKAHLGARRNIGQGILGAKEYLKQNNAVLVEIVGKINASSQVLSQATVLEVKQETTLEEAKAILEVV